MKSPDDLNLELQNLLKAYLRQWPEEAAVVSCFSEFVRTASPLQGKGNPAGHVTASAWILNPGKDRVLLTHHKKLGIWVQLGGHTDEGEGWQEAALREAEEESGLQEIRLVREELFDIDIHTIPGRPGTPEHLHYDLRFLMEADDSRPLEISDESHDLKWVSLKALQDYTGEESQFRMRRKTQGLHP